MFVSYLQEDLCASFPEDKYTEGGENTTPATNLAQSSLLDDVLTYFLWFFERRERISSPIVLNELRELLLTDTMDPKFLL